MEEMRGLDDYIITAKYDGMIRTQIQLEPRQYKGLRALGARSGKGLAAQVREAVEVYLSQHGRREPLESALGKFRPIAAKKLKPHDRDYAASLR
jgi:hypothetical protein